MSTPGPAAPRDVSAGGHGPSQREMGGSAVDDDDVIEVRHGDATSTFSPDAVVTIGRDPTNAVVLPNPNVSRRHAELRFTGGVWTLTDVGSTQGVFAGSERVTTYAIADDNDIIIGTPGVGEVLTVHVRSAGPPSEEPTVILAGPATPGRDATTAAAGQWRRDPSGRYQMRWHDGLKWTDRVLDGATVVTDPHRLAPSLDEPGVAKHESAVATDGQAQPMTAAPSRRRPRWMVPVGALLVALGVVMVVVVMSRSHPEEATVTGTFDISNGSYDPTNEFESPNFTTDGAGGCEGNSGYGDLNSITQVVVTDDHAKEVARTELGQGRASARDCVFTFTFKVKEGPKYYVVTVGRRGSSQYTFAQLQQPDSISLIIGNR
jgi:FHA domain